MPTDLEQERELLRAERDAEICGIGYLVDGVRVSPERVRVFYRDRAALAAPAAPQHATIIDHKEKEMLTDDQIKTMVDRFLAWKLPADFAPDAGIKFDPVFNKGTPYEMRHEPTGTNLFHAQQAEAMVRHMVEGIAAPQPEAAPQAQPSDAKQAVMDWMGENDVVLKDRAFKQLCALLSRYGAAPQEQETLPATGNWRDEFSLRIYENLAAADNQDLPLEEYPSRILSIMDAMGIGAAQVPVAYETIKGALREDDAYAWSWHCNLAMPIMDAIHCTHRQANDAAARLMGHLFGIDVTGFQEWKACIDGAAPQAGEDAKPVDIDPAFIADLDRSRTKYPGIARMFDGLMGEVDELRRAYNGDGDIRAEAFDVAVCAYRIATEGDDGGNTMLEQPAAQAAPAVLDMLAERRRQQEVEGWMPQHDDEHVDGEMAVAAGYYALACGFPHERDIGQGHAPDYWPWDKTWWKPRTARENLVRAGALILAEIERLDRAALTTQGADHG